MELVWTWKSANFSLGIYQIHCQRLKDVPKNFWSFILRILDHEILMHYNTRKSVKSVFTCLGLIWTWKCVCFFRKTSWFIVNVLKTFTKILIILFGEFWLQKFMDYSTQKLEKLHFFTCFVARLNLKMCPFSRGKNLIHFQRLKWHSQKNSSILLKIQDHKNSMDYNNTQKLVKYVFSRSWLVWHLKWVIWAVVTNFLHR